MIKLLSDAKNGVQSKIYQKSNLTSSPNLLLPEPKRESSRSRA